MEQKNVITIQGVIGMAEPFTAGETKAVRLSIAVDRTYTAKDGSKVKEVIWHSCTIFGRAGFPSVDELTVGKMINITGRQRCRRFSREDGSEGYAWEIVPKTVTLDIPEDKKNVQFCVVRLAGRVGSVRLTQVGDKTQALVSVATDFCYKDRSSQELVVETVWHQVAIWSNKGVKDLSLIQKGMPIEIEGRVRQYKYTAANGTERSVHEVLAINWDEIKEAA